MKKTIMIVDDEPDNVSTVKIVLEKGGYSVVAATSGDDCLSKLAKQKVDLVLMDIMMPGTPVREVVEKIKKTKIAYFSVVRVSDAEREEMLSSKNVVDFIQKPYDINDLLARIKNILK
jgi:CheY-like chemotaxis protein